MKKIVIMLFIGINLVSYANLFNNDSNEDKSDTGSNEYVVNDQSKDTPNEEPQEEQSTETYAENMESGDSSFSDENYSQSLNFYMSAFKEKNDDIDALLGIAKSYEQMNQVDKALGVYRKILKLSPQNTIANRKYLVLNKTFFSKWSYKEKEKYFEHFETYLKENHYNSSEDIYILGRIYMDDQSFERAYHIFTKDTSGDIRNYFGAATTAKSLGKYSVAIEYYDKLIAEKPDFYPAYLGLGSAYKLQGNYESAIINLKIYLENQEDENVYVGIADIYMAQDKYPAAKAILEEGQNKFPSSETIRESLREIYSRSK